MDAEHEVEVRGLARSELELLGARRTRNGSISAHRERCGEIRDVATAESWRRRGVATAVMGELERMAQETGFRRVGLSVGLDETYAAARALYPGLRHAQGPLISSVSLEAEDGRLVARAGVLTYLVKDL